jgi:nicotinamidase-related amidase
MKMNSAVRLPANSTALIIIDLISDFRFEDGRAIARQALPAARRISALKARAAAARVPSLYVNDNWGRWRSDFRDLVMRCRAKDCLGAPILEILAPAAADYSVLKPTHAGFFGTPLEHLLSKLGVRTLIMTGISAHQCVLFTANEAFLRNYRLVIPRDCVASKTARQRQFAMDYFSTVLHASTPLSRALSFFK